MKKKVIFIHSALWIGGIETALVNILNRFDYEKYDVTCLILSNHTEFAHKIPKQCELLVADRFSESSFSRKYKFSYLSKIIEKPQNVSHLRLFVWRLLDFFIRPVEERLYARYIRKNMPQNGFDAAFLFSSGICGTAVKAVDAKKYICFYHYSDLRRVFHDSKGYEKCSRIFAVSQNIADKLNAFMPEYANKIEGLHNLVDTVSIKGYAEKEPEQHFCGDTFNIVSCGRLNKDKGFDLAIKACKSLLEKGLNIKWYVLGGGPEEASLKNQAKECGVKDTIIFLGSCINPYPYMKQADLFVQSSRIEAFGLTITEALALGVPVVSTKTDGGTEIITDGENGILCDISWESIESAVERAINDPAFLKKLKCGAQSTDFEKSNSDIMNRLYEEID